MSEVYRGRAQIQGVDGDFDVLIRRINQSVNVTQSFDENIVQDATGNDIAWLARNEKYEGDFQFVLVANDTSTRAQVATAATFLAPYAIVTLSNFELTWLNTTWQYVSGANISLDQAMQGKNSVRLRRYADATQNGIAATTPS